MFIGTLAVVPETRGEATRRGLDPLGIILSIAGLGGIVYGLIEGQRFGRWEPSAMAPHGWPLSPVPVAFAIGIACLVAFVLLERARRAADKVVLVDLSLFSLRSFRIGSLAALVVALANSACSSLCHSSSKGFSATPRWKRASWSSSLRSAHS